ncbi:MAG TPA: hypothetical protein VJH34_04315 [archaeon]|nr:hypothetical protein [archaeon]
MDDLEISVRERLGEWEASILLDYLKRNPQYNSRMNDALEKYSQNVKRSSESLKFTYFDDNQTDKMTSFLSVALMDKLDLETLIKTHRYSFIDLDSSTRLTEQSANRQSSILNLSGENAKHNILDKYKTKDAIAQRVIKVARERGLAEALKDETIYGVIREILPTEESYRLYKMRGTDIMKRLIKQSSANNILNLKEIIGVLNEFYINVWEEQVSKIYRSF